jgi:hypothetical protein
MIFFLSYLCKVFCTSLIHEIRLIIDRYMLSHFNVNTYSSVLFWNHRYNAIVAIFDPLEEADVAVTLPADFNTKYRLPL